MLASISRHARARHCLNTKRKAAPIAEGGYRLVLLPCSPLVKRSLSSDVQRTRAAPYGGGGHVEEDD
jgi:hypothetical protein